MTDERKEVEQRISDHHLNDAVRRGGPTPPAARCDSCRKPAWCTLVRNQFLCDTCRGLAS